MGSSQKRHFIMSALLCILVSILPCLTVQATTDCRDGILVVGGKTISGPSQQVTLLSSQEGWCDKSGFPDLPFPLVSPGAYHVRGYLLVCGFPEEFPCMYTRRGWSEWSPLYSLANQTDYKMTYSAKVGSVMMVSKDTEVEGTNWWEGIYHIQHNPVHHNPGGITQWMQISGSPFNLGRGLRDAELSGYNGDLYLSGGFDVAEGGFGSTAGSVGSVARWSVSGTELVSGPPAFEDGVVPDMSDQWGGGQRQSSITGREGHASAVFTENLVVGGGFCHHLESCGGGATCCQCNSCRTLPAVEYYDGGEWRNMADMVQARAHFGLQPMCGMLVALGGVTVHSVGDGVGCTEDQLLSSLEVAWSLEGEWVEEDWLEMPEARSHFAALAVTDMECM